VADITFVRLFLGVRPFVTLEMFRLLEATVTDVTLLQNHDGSRGGREGINKDGLGRLRVKLHYRKLMKVGSCRGMGAGNFPSETNISEVWPVRDLRIVRVP
jgi:hypothetical protein